jgi:lipoprotein LprG
MRLLSRSAALLLAAAVLACSGPSPGQPNPSTVLRQAGQAMSGLHSVSADVTFGPGVVVDGLTLSSATSKLQLPDASDTVFKVKQGDFLVDLRLVTTGGHVYLRLPFSKFTELPPDDSKDLPNLAQLFDRTTGLPAVLPAGQNPRYQVTEQVGGVDSDRVTATYTADQIGTLLGVKPAGDVQATIWVARSDHLVRRVILDGPLLSAGTNVRVQVDFHDFNKPVAIATPL